jgi:hypothetical protein
MGKGLRERWAVGNEGGAQAVEKGLYSAGS